MPSMMLPRRAHLRALFTVRLRFSSLQLSWPGHGGCGARKPAHSVAERAAESLAGAGQDKWSVYVFAARTESAKC